MGPQKGRLARQVPSWSMSRPLPGEPPTRTGLEETAAGELFWHWGDNETFKALVFGSRDAATAVVVLTNGKTGLRACRPIVEAVFPGEHPALGFRMLNY